jgi:predicted metal-binding membrane protein
LTIVLPLAIVVAAWTWVMLLARDMYGSMQGASAWMMTTVWDAPHVALLWLMWAVMMIAMMVPSAAPLILLYAAAARKSGVANVAVRVYALTSGYVLLWVIFSRRRESSRR